MKLERVIIGVLLVFNLIFIVVAAQTTARYENFTRHEVICTGQKVTLVEMSLNEARQWVFEHCRS